MGGPMFAGGGFPGGGFPGKIDGKGPPQGKGGGGPGPGGMFRSYRYGLDHPAFQGKTLRPGKTLVEIQEERDKAQANQDATLAKAKTTDGAK